MINRLVVVDVAPNISPNAHILQRYFSLMQSVDLKQQLLQVGGSLPALRAHLMADWESSIEVGWFIC